MNEFERLFDGKRYVLTQKLCVSHELLHNLWDANLLTKEEHQSLSRLVDGPGFRIVLALLEILSRKQYSMIHVFFDVLHVVDQSHIVNVLRPGELQHVTEIPQ